MPVGHDPAACWKTMQYKWILCSPGHSRQAHVHLMHWEAGKAFRMRFPGEEFVATEVIDAYATVCPSLV